MLKTTANLIESYPGASAALTAGILALVVIGAPAAYAAVGAVYAIRNTRSAS